MIATQLPPPTSSTRLSKHRALLQLVHFTWSSGSGLAADLAVFAALVYVGGDAFRANIASASIAITLTYLLVSRFSFRAVPTWRSYVTFAAWYALSATLVSATIELIAGSDHRAALLVKACSIPVTFVTNYAFSRWLFAGGAERLIGRSGFAMPERLQNFGRFVAAHRASAVALLGSAWFQVLIFPITSRVGFDAPSAGDVGGWSRVWGLRLLFAVVFFAVLRFMIRFGAAVRAGSRQHRFWLLSSGSLLGVNLLILLLIYPGLWIWDEFGVLGLTRVYSGTSWQGYLTHIYYALSLYLIPTAVGIVVVQMAFASVVGGYVLATVRASVSRPWVVLLCAIPLVSFVTLANNAYPLRLTAYSYVLLLALTRLFIAWRSARSVSPAALLGFALLVGVLTFWRTEGVVFLVLLPAYAIAGRIWTTWHLRRGATAVAAVAAVLSIAAVGQVARQGADPHYEVTAFVNPLSTMLQHPLRSSHLAKDYAAIDRVIDINALRANPSYLEIPAFWAVGTRPGFEQRLPAFKAAYVDLVLNNPALFLQNRWQAFLATNSMESDHLPQIHGGGVGLFSDDPSVDASFSTFTATNYFSEPLSPVVRSAVLKTLLLTDADKSSPASAVVWNAAPVLLALLAVLVFGLRRRRWVWAVCAATLLLQSTLIFLTAPGAFFMYYFPAYLAGGVLVCSLTAVALDAALTRRAARTLVRESAVPHPSIPESIDA